MLLHAGGAKDKAFFTDSQDILGAHALRIITKFVLATLFVEFFSSFANVNLWKWKSSPFCTSVLLITKGCHQTHCRNSTFF